MLRGEYIASILEDRVAVMQPLQGTFRETPAESIEQKCRCIYIVKITGT
jgi:hypothetical protein